MFTAGLGEVIPMKEQIAAPLGPMQPPESREDVAKRHGRVFIERDGRRLMVRPEQAKPKAKPSEVKSDG